MPSPLVGEGYTVIGHKLLWVRGWLCMDICIRGEDPSSGGFAATFSHRGEGTFQAGVKNGSGAPSVGLNTTVTFWPIFRLDRSQSTKFVCKDGPSFNVT